jgi:dihydropteroate synthase
VTGKIYLRPIGIIWGTAAKLAMEEGLALPLAGGPGAFLAAELIEGGAGSAKRVIARASTLAALNEHAVQRLLDRICAPRPPLGNLSLYIPRIMGILNVTPDSFSDGGDHNRAEEAAAHARTLAAEGAAIIDIGGESTRPGSETVPLEEERRRVLPVLERLKGSGLLISVDTRKAAIMREAAAAGAGIINDVSALEFEPDSLAAAAQTGLPVVLMHAQGDPKHMQDNPAYKDVLLEVYDYLEARVEAAIAAGLPREKLIVDPGIGFGKTFEHNLALIEGISLFHALGCPILAGISRKGVTGRLANEPDPKKRDYGSAAAAVTAVAQGVAIVRVHNVAATDQSLRVWQASVGIHSGY